MSNRKLSLTRRKLIEMLTENTGRALCDSGGAYGRNWERNQGLDFESRPAATLKFDARYGDIEATLDVYHWLVERVDYDAGRTQSLHRFGKTYDDYWLNSIQKWVEKRGGAGLYGDGKPTVVNTYNGEDLLSQTLQYVFWTEDEGNSEFIALQIHGGCDVRGGYTAPKVFEVSSDDYSIFDNAKATIWVELEKSAENQATLPGLPAPRPPHWYTDDGCHWYHEGASGLGAGRQLEDYEFSEDPEDRGAGKIYVDEDGNGYCPITGGKLRLSSI